MARYGFIIDKIREIFNEPERKIFLHSPVFPGNEKKYLEDCIDSTYVSSVGKYVDLFESKIALYTGAKAAVVCVNGTNALYLGMKMAGVTGNDEVITQPLTFIATLNAISYCGAVPVFVDVDAMTLGMSHQSLSNFLESESFMKDDGCYNRKTGRRIKACVPMHTFGHPCKIDEIVKICSERRIELIEDAAESIGSFYKGIHTGIFGRTGVLSFNGNKTITTGGGGMLLFNDVELAKRAKHLTTQAKIPHPWEFIHDDTGYNYRMPNINAAIGVAQLENLDMFINKKRQLAAMYSAFFAGSEISFFNEPENSCSNYWLNAIFFNDVTERDIFLEESNSMGVMTRPAWRLMNKLEMFRNCQAQPLSNAEWIEQRLVNIPSSVIL